MRRLVLCLFLALAAITASFGARPVQADPQFKLGFQTLATLIPSLVGQPTEDEHHNPDTGDALQRTTRGMLVWRKADNFTAFTDGAATWVLGPFGLQSRPNGERFDWERSDGLPSLSRNAASFSFTRAADGTWLGQGTVRNPLANPMDVEINVFALASPGGQPLMDAPTEFLLGLAGGASRSFVVRIPTTADSVAWDWRVDSHPASARERLFMDVGAARPLSVDPMLAGTVRLLMQVEGGGWLVRVAAENGVRIDSEPTGPGVLGNYAPDGNVIILSSRLNASSAWVRAAVLAHELQHAADAAAGAVPTNASQCYQFESEAFQRQATTWTELWRGNLPPPIDAMHAELNDVTLTISHDPQAFALQLVRRYRAECSVLEGRGRHPGGSR